MSHPDHILKNAPIGTRAPAFSGGWWQKTDRGWIWCAGDTFPRPGGDWTGNLIYPPEGGFMSKSTKDGLQLVAVFAAVGLICGLIKAAWLAF